MKVNNEIQDGFKMTELGILPEEWEVVRIVDYCDFERGTEPGSNSYNRKGIGVPFIRVGNIAAGIQELVFTSFNNIRLCAKEDILMSFDGSPGVVVKGFEGAYSSGIRKVIPKADFIDKSFTYYVLQTEYVQRVIEEYTTGVTIKHASKALPHFKIPLPPLPEQKKIAAVLSAVQSAKEKTEEVIKATKELKKSLMKHLFTYGVVEFNELESVRSSGSLRVKETEIGPMPEEWEVVRFEDVSQINNENRDPTTDMPDEYFTYIDIAGVEGETGRIIETKNILGKNAPSRARRVIHANDVILSTVRPYLKAFTIVPDEYENQICSTGFAVLSAKEGVIPKYLLYVSCTDLVGTQFESQMRGANYPALNTGHIKNTKIPLPPLPIQKKIAEILSAIDDKIKAEQNKKKALKELFKTLLSLLMTGKIRVKNINT